MNRSMNKIIYALLPLLFLTIQSQGVIGNGSFELYDPNTSQWFSAPLDWVYENYAGVHNSFIPEPEASNNKGQLVHWSIDSPANGDLFCLLSTGDLGERSDPITIHAQVVQTIELYPGDYIKGSYFFGTCDWLPYNDSGRISLIGHNQLLDPNYVELAYIDVSDVGDCSAMDDWNSFTYKYTGNQVQTYDLICEVSDELDTIYKSYLAIDDLYICRAGKSEGDLNGDCKINIQDFTLLSEAWMATCTDPNTFGDPNTPCFMSDTDESNTIDCRDFNTMVDWWLFDTY